jgi:hypothetical protein
MVGGLLKAQLRHLANENLGEVPKLRTKGSEPNITVPISPDRKWLPSDWLADHCLF